MTFITIRCHAELNDFLPRDRRHTIIVQPLHGHPSIKDVIEAGGIPHPEVGSILVMGEPVSLSYLVRADDHIEIFPTRQLFQREAGPNALPSHEPRFVLDVHLGRLAGYLRTLGFDTLYRNNYDDAELAWISHNEDRMLLSRDLGLLKRSIVRDGCYVRATDPQQQVFEIVGRFDLYDRIVPFKRCSRCNGLLQAAPKEEVSHLVPPRIRAEHDEFHRCQACAQIYWKGSHYERLQRWIAEVHAQNPRYQGQSAMPAVTEDESA